MADGVNCLLISEPQQWSRASVNSTLVGRERRIPEAHWPASLTKPVRSAFRETLSFPLSPTDSSHLIPMRFEFVSCRLCEGRFLGIYFSQLKASP